MSRVFGKWLLLWLILLGLSSWTPLASQDSEESVTPMSAAEVVQLFGASVVLVQAEMSNGEMQTGSGFFVAPKGVVATSLHVLDGAKSVLVRVEGQRFEATSVRAFDLERDLALIQIDAEGFETTVPGDTTSLRRGDPVRVISNPLGLVGTVSEGLLGAWREPGAEVEDDLDPMAQLVGLPQGRLLQISAPVSPGSSGAPVFDENGYVVGMVAAALAAGALDLNFAVPIEVLIPLLEVDEGWDLASLQSTLDRRRQDLADPHLVDARFYIENQEFEEASRAVDRALGLFPRSGEALMLKGEVLLLAGYVEEAGLVFRIAVEVNPESAEAWENLGGFFLEHGPRERRGEAVAALERALDLDPWRPEAAFGLGVLYAAQRRLGEARAMLERAVEADRYHLRAWVALGRLCMALKDTAAAKEAFESALWIDRDYAPASCALDVLRSQRECHKRYTVDGRLYGARCRKLSECPF